jgi:hypothetical protein
MIATAEAKAGTSGETRQICAKRLYLPEWRRAAIEKIQKAEREASGTELGTEAEVSQDR